MVEILDEIKALTQKGDKNAKIAFIADMMNLIFIFAGMGCVFFYGWQKFGWLNTTPTIRQPETAQSNTAQPTPNSQTTFQAASISQPTP